MTTWKSTVNIFRSRRSIAFNAVAQEGESLIKVDDLPDAVKKLLNVIRSIAKRQILTDGNCREISGGRRRNNWMPI